MNRNREYRTMALTIPDSEENRYTVEGYASTFDPYVLMTVDGIDYSERIEPTAFEGADLSDVVFRVDHTGSVYARSSAGTVEVWPDEHGLATRANLGRTQRARELFADIEAGNYPQMSFAFVVAEDGDYFDGVIEAEKAERLKREKRERQKQKLKMLMEVNKWNSQA